MSTFLRFKDGQTVHIYDVCIGGVIHHKCIETGIVYERERTAIKRALMTHRKKLYNSTRTRRRRRKIVHQRRNKMLQEIIRPMIITMEFDGKMRHLVVDTGKKFKHIKNAIKHAISYAKRNQ